MKRNNALETLDAASAAEDFWMFLSFAMISLVMILTTYINGLSAIKANDVERKSKTETEELSSTNKAQIEIFVVEEKENIFYKLGDKGNKFKIDELDSNLEKAFQAFNPKPESIDMYIRASGKVLYQSVFDALEKTQSKQFGNSKIEIFQIYKKKE